MSTSATVQRVLINNYIDNLTEHNQFVEENKMDFVFWINNKINKIGGRKHIDTVPNKYRKTTVSGSTNFPLQSIQIMRGEVALENTTILSDIDETGTLVTNKTFSTLRTTASQRFSYKCVIPELKIRISGEDRNIVKNLLDDARDKFNQMFRCVNNFGEIKKNYGNDVKKKNTLKLIIVVVVIWTLFSFNSYTTKTMTN